MKIWCFSLLVVFSLTCSGQTEQLFTVKKPFVINDTSLYYTYTPLEDVFSDSAFTYLLFLPERKVCWFFSNVPPQQQNTTKVSGLIAGTFDYQQMKDTITFFKAFYEGKGTNSGLDLFTCVISGDHMNGYLQEKIRDVQFGEIMYFPFRLFRKKEE